MLGIIESRVMVALIMPNFWSNFRPNIDTSIRIASLTVFLSYINPDL